MRIAPLALLLIAAPAAAADKPKQAPPAVVQKLLGVNGTEKVAFLCTRFVRISIMVLLSPKPHTASLV